MGRPPVGPIRSVTRSLDTSESHAVESRNLAPSGLPRSRVRAVRKPLQSCATDPPSLRRRTMSSARARPTGDSWLQLPSGLYDHGAALEGRYAFKSRESRPGPDNEPGTSSGNGCGRDAERSG